MHLTEAVDTVREKLVRHRLPERTTLWATILKQIAKLDGFDDPALGEGVVPSLLRDSASPSVSGCPG
jgi:hypothetical protein